MVATAGLLGILGLPLELQGYWTEHSEQMVLPTALSLLAVPPQGSDALGPLGDGLRGSRPSSRGPPGGSHG